MVTTLQQSAESGETIHLQQLRDELDSIRAEMVELETAAHAEQFALDESHRESAKNLLHYLSLRRRDLRHIQHQLAAEGLSSLGRAESHVKSSVEAIEGVLSRLIENHHEQTNSNGALSYHGGLDLLASHTERLLGPKPENRSVRIMVTMPAEAAENYDFVRKLILNGMNCMRVNCAYDDVSVWSKMMQMFPERIGQLRPVQQHILLRKGDCLILTRAPLAGEPAVYDGERVITLPHISISLPEIFDDVCAGEQIWFDDGAIGGVIKKAGAEEIVVEITHARMQGSKLRADQGINLPDTTLRLPSLTEKDLDDLQFIATHADVVGYSFVKSATEEGRSIINSTPSLEND